MHRIMRSSTATDCRGGLEPPIYGIDPVWLGYGHAGHSDGKGRHETSYSAKSLFREDPGRPSRCVLHTQLRTNIEQKEIVPACMQYLFHFVPAVFQGPCPIGVRIGVQRLWRPPEY
jgi:hypothetical protein